MEQKMDGYNNYKKYFITIIGLLLAISSLNAMLYDAPNNNDKRIKEIEDHLAFINNHIDEFIKSTMKQFNISEEDAIEYYHQLVDGYEDEIQKLHEKDTHLEYFLVYNEDPENIRGQLRGINDEITYYEKEKNDIIQNFSIGYQISKSEALEQYERNLSNLKDERDGLLLLLGQLKPELTVEEYIKKIE